MRKFNHCLKENKMTVIFMLLSIISCVLTTEVTNDDPLNSQLYDFIQQMPKSQIKKMIDSITSSKNKKCQDNFDISANKVIRTNASMENGAKFIGYMPSDSEEACLKFCCEKSVEGCDLAVYSRKFINDTFNKHICYAFKCFNDDKNENTCLFKTNTKFVTLSRKLSKDLVLKQLVEEESMKLEQIKTYTSKTTDSSLFGNKIKIAKVEDEKFVYEQLKNNTEKVVFVEEVHEDEMAILPLAVGLAVVLMILFMVMIRLRIMKKRLLIGKGKYMEMKMDESDYLINGMYL